MLLKVSFFWKLDSITGYSFWAFDILNELLRNIYKEMSVCDIQDILKNRTLFVIYKKALLNSPTKYYSI